MLLPLHTVVEMISEHWVKSFCLSGRVGFLAFVPVLTTVVYLWVGFPKPRSVKRSCRRWRKSQMVWWTSLCIQVPLTNPRTEALPSSNMRATGQQLWPAANSYQVTARNILLWVTTATIGYQSSGWNLVCVMIFGLVNLQSKKSYLVFLPLKSSHIYSIRIHIAQRSCY